MGWPGFTTQTRSRSPASRQHSAQLVPMSRLKSFDQCPECKTINPMPASTRCCTRVTVSSST